MNIPATLLAVGALLAAGASRACELRHIYEDWPPYLYRDAANTVVGLDVQLIAAIARQAKCTVKTLPTVPARRRDLMFRSGEANLIPAASDIPERHSYARFSNAYRHETVRLFTTPDKLARYRDLSSFDAIVRDKLPLLVPSTGWYGKAYAHAADALRASGQLRTFDTIGQGIRMFGAGRADLIMGDGPGITYLSAQAGIKLVPLPFVVRSAPVHLMLSTAASSEEDLKRINEAIAALEKRGTLAAIRATYD